MEQASNSFKVSHLTGDALIRQLVDKRKSLGLSQKNLAWRIGIDAANMCRYEKGLIRPSIDMLFLWCDALDLEFRVLPKRVLSFDLQ